MNIKPSRTPWKTLVVAVALTSAGTFLVARRPGTPFVGRPTAPASAPAPAPSEFTRVAYGKGVARSRPGVDLLIESSTTPKRTYAIMVVGPSSGSRALHVNVEFSYGGKVVYRGTLADDVPPYSARLTTVTFTADVINDPDFVDEPPGDAPVVTRLEAMVK
jgi:hypothetical protein